MKAARQQAIVDLLINQQPDHRNLVKTAQRQQETIRRDLSELQAQGVLRNHGRAKVIHQRSQDSGDPFTCG
jgi:DeoR family L-fucose operon activator